MTRKIYGTIYTVDAEDVKTEVAKFEMVSGPVALIQNEDLEPGSYIVETVEEISTDSVKATSVKSETIVKAAVAA